MNIRKNIDYSAMFTAMDAAVKAGLPQMKLYCELGRLIGERQEKGAAVAAAEHLHSRFPDVSGFSPRNLRRMREFYRMYTGNAELLALAMKIAWTQNVVILEANLEIEERRWYLRAVGRFGWSKEELQRKIDSNAYLEIQLDELEVQCYTELNRNDLERTEYDQDTFPLSRQDRSLTAGTPDMSAFFGNNLCDLHHTYTKKLPLRSPDKKPQVGPVLPA